MMNAGKILIGTAMLVFSFALLVTPSGAVSLPDSHSIHGKGFCTATTPAGTCTGGPCSAGMTCTGISSATRDNFMPAPFAGNDGTSRSGLQQGRATSPALSDFTCGGS